MTKYSALQYSTVQYSIHYKIFQTQLQTFRNRIKYS